MVAAASHDPDRRSESVRAGLASAKVWVVKVGSALLTGDGQGIDADSLDRWCGQIADLHVEGRRVVVVSSGAVAEGCRRLGFDERPVTIHDLQAAAAVGQSGVSEAYEQAFRRHGRHIGLVLLTHDDLSDRQRYLNARTTLTTLLDLGVVPVINENDSVATEEIKLGDNDTLAGMVASLLSADVLVLLTDQKGLHEVDPRLEPGRRSWPRPLRRIRASMPWLAAARGRLGRGGMVTKLAAARLAALSGTHTVIADGGAPDILRSLAHGEPVGTLLTADVAPLDARKRWIAQLRARGPLHVDAGAVVAIVNRGVSILPAGVAAADGSFPTWRHGSGARPGRRGGGQGSRELRRCRDAQAGRAQIRRDRVDPRLRGRTRTRPSRQPGGPLTWKKAVNGWSNAYGTTVFARHLARTGCGLSTRAGTSPATRRRRSESRRRLGTRECAYLGGEAGLVTGGLVVMHDALVSHPVDHGDRIAEGGGGRGLVSGIDRRDDLLDVGAHHRAVAGVAGSPFDGLARALAGLGAVGQESSFSRSGGRKAA